MPPEPDPKMLIVDELRVELVRGPVKAVRLRLRADGSIRLSAPGHVTEQRLRHFVREQRGWLTRQQQRQQQRQAPTEDLRSGGRVLLWGRWLEVTRRPGPRASAERGRTGVSIVAPDDEGARRAMQRLRSREVSKTVEELAPALIARLGQAPEGYRFRAMTSQWGSCNTLTRQITINTWLAQRHPEELEYVLAHELSHLVQRGHGAPFRAVMDHVLPSWRGVRRQLQAHLPPRG